MILSHGGMYCVVVSCLVYSYLVVSCPVLPYFILSCLALSCHVCDRADLTCVLVCGPTSTDESIVNVHVFDQRAQDSP